MPLIPPLLENDVLILDFEEKAQIFNDYFILQCSAIETGNGIPNDDVISDVQLLSNILISDEKLQKDYPSIKCEQISWMGWYLSTNDTDMRQLSPTASENDF